MVIQDCPSNGFVNLWRIICSANSAKLPTKVGIGSFVYLTVIIVSGKHSFAYITSKELSEADNNFQLMTVYNKLCKPSESI